MNSYHCTIFVVILRIQTENILFFITLDFYLFIFDLKKRYVMSIKNPIM